MKKIQNCPHIKRIVCNALQNYHIEHHISRYVHILRDSEYLNMVNMTKEQANREIMNIYEKRRSLQAFDEVKDGLRVKKVSCILLQEILD
tara:strand:+ start:548 stop:817 length:270 start_codon:yes stop_codon:yes gene_type:complete